MIIVAQNGKAINFDAITALFANECCVAVVTTAEDMSCAFLASSANRTPWVLAHYRSEKIARAVVGEIIAAYEHGARVYRLPNNNYSPKEE